MQVGPGLEEIPVLGDAGEAKIGQLDVVVGIQQKILRLEVPVHDHVCVAVLDTCSTNTTCQPLRVRVVRRVKGGG